MNDEDALRDVCKLQAFGGEDPNSPYHRSLQLKKHYVAAAMELRSCWALNAHNPESEHHSRYCAAWEAYHICRRAKSQWLNQCVEQRY